MKKILITGGAGNVGASLARHLVKNPDNFVTIIDNLSTGRMENLPTEHQQRWEFIKADVNNYNEIAPIMIARKYEHVFHYAAVVGVFRTVENPLTVLNDISGIKNILDLSARLCAKRVYFSSSSEVYGEPVEMPQKEEETPLNARLPYAVVKNLGECYLKAYYKEHGLQYTIFRFFNTYGPLQSDDFVLSKFIKRAINREPIEIYGDGSQTRTFCHVSDNIAVTEKILEDGLFPCDTINIGSDEEITINDLAKLVVKITESDSRIVYLSPLKEGDMSRRRPDISKMRSVIGRNLLTLEQGINQLLSSLNSG